MPEVLPPRPAGTAAAPALRPDVDVVFVANAGLDKLTSVRRVWEATPVADTPMGVGRWHVAAKEAPRSEDEVADWLNGQWAGVGRWVTDQVLPGPLPESAEASQARLPGSRR